MGPSEKSKSRAGDSSLDRFDQEGFLDYYNRHLTAGNQPMKIKLLKQKIASLRRGPEKNFLDSKSPRNILFSKLGAGADCIDDCTTERSSSARRQKMREIQFESFGSKELPNPIPKRSPVLIMKDIPLKYKNKSMTTVNPNQAEQHTKNSS